MDNEVLRLYPRAPNVQRQARGDIQVEQDTVDPDDPDDPGLYAKGK